MIDGYDVHIGDNLYDISLGLGTVLSINNDNSIIVKIGNRNVRYNPDGTVGQSKVQRLFWQDYGILPHPRPGAKGKKEMEAVKQVWLYFRDYTNGN